MYLRPRRFRPTGFVFRDLRRELREFGTPEDELITKYVRRLMARGYTKEQAEKIVKKRIELYKEKEIGGH
jgi:ribosomal protein S7